MKINSTNNHHLSFLYKKVNGNPPEFICPFCKSNTPLIQDIYIDRNTKSPYLAFKCKCNNKNENAIISLDEYFKAFTEQKMCFKHDNNKAELYCKKCSLYMCETCSNYHSLFKSDHDSYLKKVTSMNLEANNSIDENMIFLKNKTKSKTFLVFEKSYNKIIQEYNEYISAENKIINEMILNLNQLQKDIQQNREIVMRNSNQIMLFVKSLYEAYDTSNNNINESINYEKIVKMQKISTIDSFLFKRDNELINSICQHFNQILKVMLNQQFDMVTRSTVIIVKNDIDSNMLSSNRQISTTVEMSENEKIPLGEFSYLENTKGINNNIEYENSTSEIKQYFNKNYISISPTSSQSLLFNESDDNINIFSNNPTPGKSSQLSEDITLDRNKSNLDNNTNDDEELHYLTQNESICTLTEQGGPITSIIQLKNCRDKTMNHQIVTAGNTNYILFWNPSTYQAINKISSRKGNITVLFELLDGSLAMSYDNCIIKIYLLPKKICTSILIGHANIITSMLQIHPKVFITASKDQSIKFWDTIENNCLYTINEHEKGINCLLYIEQETFASCGDDSKIIFYTNNKKQFELIGHKGYINTICKLSSDILASGGEEFNIKLWDFKKRQCIGSLIRHTSSINYIISLLPSDDNQYIALSVSNDGTIILWNVNTRMSIKEIKKAHNSPISVALMTEDNKLYTGGSDGLIKIWT